MSPEPASGELRGWWKLAEWFGRVALTLGILTGLFVAHQLWGTEFLHDREQSALRSQLEAQIDASDASDAAARASLPSPGDPVAETRSATPVALGAVEGGHALARIEIPTIKLETVAVEGVGDDDLRKGPGHYPGTALPGEVGNAAFAGHRVTYGAPFHGLDHLEPGDQIVVTTARGRFVYLVDEQRIVPPTEVSVLDPTDDPRLTLTTCHPELSARERLVVVSSLFGEPLPPPDDPAAESARRALAAASLDGRDRAGLDGLDAGFGLWGALTAAVGGAWWWLFRRRRGLLTWFGGAVPFVAVLFFFFAQVEGLVPATF